MDYSKVKVIEIEGIDHSDAPDYCDAYVSNAEYDGVVMNQEQLDELNEDRDFVHEQVINKLY